MQDFCNSSLTLAKAMLLQDPGPWGSDSISISSMAAVAGTSEVQGLGMEEFHGCTLLHLACETADIWMIELLLQYGVAVLSGNRNFELRVHPLTRANYLASPPLVVAYALVGMASKDSPVLMYLPGLEGTGTGLVVHEKTLGK
ncbi:unnamed protein product [Lactuca saligna]|uniref:Aconitase/3-isopropylmalate dehydratase large subunit alpha/beta/alpha domain-containing protein n=1 Tax=Lactuca saligna TaxID=75948 RepID=A0AA35YPM0_LACSI|nr:unnamed protein product [Lactuca saligna]